MDITERALAGARARAQALSREERRAIGRQAYLRGAARTVATRAAELTPAEREQIRRALGERS